MENHNLLKKISLGIASLALICPLAMSGLNTNANASSRYYFNNVRHPNNPVERAFDRRGWTSGPMFDFTGAHITIHGKHYTVHGTSAVGGYLTLNGFRYHARRTHRVYRHHRRARKATRRRRGRKAKRTRRTRRTRRSHRRVARKATRRPRIIKAHKARKAHNHRINNDSLLAAYEREAETENTLTPVHHESQAEWYKHNALRIYNNNINSSHMFRRGFIDGTGGIDPDGSDILVYNNGSGGGNEGEGSIERRYANNSQYKHGWIISNPLGLYYTIDTKGKIKEESKSDYTRSLNRWNTGIEYLKTNNQAGLIDYDNDDGQWSRDGSDQYATMNHQQNPFY